MGTDLIIPEILLIDKLEEMETSLSPTVWQQMRTEIELAEKLEETDKSLPPALRVRKKMTIQDFVNKAINLPLEIIPTVEEQTAEQLYRLHLFCCQRAVHYKDVQRNPFLLGFKALEEMKMAIIGCLISYRLIEPSCPYSWSREFFEYHVILDKGPDGHTIIKFSGLPENIINKAINEELITDWLIYRAYDNNGIKTLMDYKNNLLTLPNYLRGGVPSVEFSRFERKMAEERNRKLQHRDQALDLEFRKTLVHKAAEQTAEQLLASGMSAADLLAQAFTDNLNQLITEQKPVEKKPKTPKKLSTKHKTAGCITPSPETEEMIAAFLKG